MGFDSERGIRRKENSTGGFTKRHEGEEAQVGGESMMVFSSSCSEVTRAPSMGTHSVPSEDVFPFTYNMMPGSPLQEPTQSGSLFEVLSPVRTARRDSADRFNIELPHLSGDDMNAPFDQSYVLKQQFRGLSLTYVEEQQTAHSRQPQTFGGDVSKELSERSYRDVATEKRAETDPENDNRRHSGHTSDPWPRSPKKVKGKKDTSAAHSHGKTSSGLRGGGSAAAAGNWKATHSRSDDSRSDPQYPARPGCQDCQYYLKTGKCTYGARCKFNHPPRDERLVNALNRRDCFDFVQTGKCPYGKNCKYNHPNKKDMAVLGFQHNAGNASANGGGPVSPVMLATNKGVGQGGALSPPKLSSQSQKGPLQEGSGMMTSMPSSNSSRDLPAGQKSGCMSGSYMHGSSSYLAQSHVSTSPTLSSEGDPQSSSTMFPWKNIAAGHVHSMEPSASQTFNRSPGGDVPGLSNRLGYRDSVTPQKPEVRHKVSTGFNTVTSTDSKQSSFNPLSYGNPLHFGPPHPDTEQAFLLDYSWESPEPQHGSDLGRVEDRRETSYMKNYL
mmetsp:Transcript_8313/g.24993  ORF Transcript_8313/g.24993 Transcript_8313/m.24993 type:complete len:554 (-) Transcript_8313:292-1953(-)